MRSLTLPPGLKRLELAEQLDVDARRGSSRVSRTIGVSPTWSAMLIGIRRHGSAPYAIGMPERIELEPDEVAGLIRGARLLELRADTPAQRRERQLATALTALDALCGLCERDGPDAAWDVLELLDRREVLAFAR